MTSYVCRAEDSAALFAFLEGHMETSMFLLGNLSGAGIDDAAARYVMAKEGATVVGVASVTAAGFVLVQAPRDPSALVWFAVRSSGTPINGILGPTAQVSGVLDGLSLHRAPAGLHSNELVYERDLLTLAADVSSDVEVRLAVPADVEVLAKLRRGFIIEALAVPDAPAADAGARADAERMCRDGATFVLVEGGEVVAMTAFSARHANVVQVGAVYTPVELRRRGRARRVVAGSLLHARDIWGAARAVLFTAETNVAAQRTYEGLGFERSSDFTLHFFREPLSVAEATSFIAQAKVAPAGVQS